MEVKDGKIVKATEDELFQHWLKNLSEIYPFHAYLYSMKSKGVKIIDS